MDSDPSHWFARFEALATTLEHGLVERRGHVRLALLAALAGEHTLLVGPPGTAKSALARRLLRAFRDARYFERLLTRFSVPEELFGPLSIRALEEDRYERHTEGFLPDATIAFIDEVFKANSAILNALLTLLNEREFDNGAGRQRCPLISVIGATNVVPEDEVAEAFFDRFLLRLPVEPVSSAGFVELLGLAAQDRDSLAAGPVPGAVSRDELLALATDAAWIGLPEALARLLGELRSHCVTEGVTVSDRRWVKIAGLLRIAAAAAGRRQIEPWDLLLLPCCTAPDGARQQALGAWLAARLGVREALAPPRLCRVVEAFEAQLELENNANDLDYDEDGRLRFSATAQGEELAGSIGDAKGGSAALRMNYSRRRRYGACHVDARVGQLDDARARIAGYAGELTAMQRSLADYRACNLWVDDVLLAQAGERLGETAAALAALAARLDAARAGFLALPRLDSDGSVPAPIAHEALVT